jgi:hypothetical protein
MGQLGSWIFWANLTPFSRQDAIPLAAARFLGTARVSSLAENAEARGEYWSARGSVALPRCTAAHPLYARLANIFGAPVSEAATRPDPRAASLLWSATALATRDSLGIAASHPLLKKCAAALDRVRPEGAAAAARAKDAKDAKVG